MVTLNCPYLDTSTNIYRRALVMIGLLIVTHKKVEVTLLTLRDVLPTSSYATLQSHAFATLSETVRKQV